MFVIVYKILSAKSDRYPNYAWCFALGLWTAPNFKHLLQTSNKFFSAVILLRSKYLIFFIIFRNQNGKLLNFFKNLFVYLYTMQNVFYFDNTIMNILIPCFLSTGNHCIICNKSQEHRTELFFWKQQFIVASEFELILQVVI